MNNTRPKVLVTGPKKPLRFGWWATRYALRHLKLNVEYASPGDHINPEEYNGLIIGGGDDVKPELYGLLNPDTQRQYDPDRDRFELNLLDNMLNRKVAMLGICRGAQLLNVAQGGSLHHDIRPLRSLTSNRRTIRAKKKIIVHSHSRLRSIIGKEQACVNSLHEQAVDRLGGDLRAVASDRDHFIQAIESPSHHFMLGVQWHPEYLPFQVEQRDLFRGFARAAHALHQS
jgi:putative glutamine amidotransferase